MGRAPISTFRLEKARQLRQRGTDAERLLWKALKQMPMEGSHFRRQVPIGQYVVDFACLAARLVIEVDGAWHGEEANAKRDAARTAWLASQGYQVLRFCNTEVIHDVSGVMAVIYSAVYGCGGVPAPLAMSARVAPRRGSAAPHPGAPGAPTLPLQGRVGRQRRHHRADKSRRTPCLTS